MNPTTSRRGFLSFLGAAAATAVLDPERLLWVPGKKLISIPQGNTTDWFDVPSGSPKILRYLDIGGQTIFPVYGTDGTLLNQSVAYREKYPGAMDVSWQGTSYDLRVNFDEIIVRSAMYTFTK